MKKRGIIALVLAIVMIAGTLTGCGETTETADVAKADTTSLEATVSQPIEIAALNGPTGMGLAPLMGDQRFNITVYQAPDQVTGKIINGEVDIAAIPSNLAAVLYNKTEGGIKVISTITMGVLYIISDAGELESFSDLDGKTVYASGQGSVPEYVMSFLSEIYGIDIHIEWLGNHADVAAKLKADTEAALAAGKDSSGTIALLPEPQVSILQPAQSSYMYNVLDINAVWEENTTEELPMGVLVAQTDFVENNAEDLDVFLANAMNSVERINSAPWGLNSEDEEVKTNAEEAISSLLDNGFFKDELTAIEAIPNCNIVMYHDDDSYQAGLNALYKLLFERNPKSIGGKLPGEDFYL